MSLFADLASTRHTLQDFTRKHFASVLEFRWGTGASFYIDTVEADSGADANPAELQHLTSSATCIESLLGCPEYFRMSAHVDPNQLASDFARSAIERQPSAWRSEDSAAIYCRCRALPTVIRHLGSSDNRIGEHVKVILRQLAIEHSRLAVGEADPDGSPVDWYPPNAFHTYWTLEILEDLAHLHSELFSELDRDLDLKRRTAEIKLWSRAQLASETALHSAKSSNLDSDQLAWALSIAARFDTDFHSDLSKQDLFRHALKCLFETQKPIGTWRHYRPLFHYRKSGNAYCFVFETFAVLLRACLQRGNQTTFFIDALKPYFKQLRALFDYASTTKTVSVSDGREVLSWSSGHRTNKTIPESWATASVFDFAQCFRRLLGCWTREDALSELNQVIVARENADTDLRRRGDTWSSGPNIAEQISSLFVNPFYGKTAYDRFEPDGQPIAEHQARAAILFGPPGTSKTTLIRSLAGVLGWDYVELHASHFVSQGLPNVQKTADEIFRRLMELDHTVVLFDEIDELVRERSEREADAFGRFLTTSMLPKLAELWQLRKVIYFVNTNHIRYFDSAITRSGRFDALLFVPPPSFESKRDQITKLLTAFYDGAAVQMDFSRESIERALASIKSRRTGKRLTANDMLAKFILVRWDQLNELAAALATMLPNSMPRVVTSERLASSLEKIADQRLQDAKQYEQFVHDRGYARRDHDKMTVYKVLNLDSGVPHHYVVSRNGENWLECPCELWSVKMPDVTVLREPDRLATVSLRPLEIIPAD